MNAKSLARTLLGPLFGLPATQIVLGYLDYYRFPEARQGWGGPLNGQEGRRALLEALFHSARFDAIVETGTYRGITTAYFAAKAASKVYSIEKDPRHYGFSLRTLKGRSNVELLLGDSAELLPPVLERLGKSRQRVLLYLDAHWGTDLPLRRELDYSFRLVENAVIAVDDFAIPDDPEYGFDDYGPGQRLDLETFGPQLAALGASVFFPRLRAREETGARRGMILAGTRGEMTELLSSQELLRAWT